jgi:hypothetical protein
MAINASGQLSLGGATVGQSINLELSNLATATITMNDTNVRNLAGVASGAISLSNFYGKSAALDYMWMYLTNFNASTAWVGTTKKITYSTDTVAAGVTPVNVTNQGYIWSSKTIATIYGGYSDANSNKLNYLWGITFATQTTFNPADPGPRWGSGFALGSDTVGYQIGVYEQTGGAGNLWNSVNLSTYAFTARGTWPNYGPSWPSLADSYIYYSMVCSTTTVGYSISGSSTSGNGFTNRVFGLIYSTNTAAVRSATVPTTPSTFINVMWQNKSFIVGSFDTSKVKFIFSTETTSTPAFTAIVATVGGVLNIEWSSPATSNLVKAYSTGTCSTTISYASSFLFSTETVSTTTLNLSYARNSVNNLWYAAIGQNPAYI